MAEKIKRGDNKLAVKAGFWYVISTFLVKGLAFITTPIFARLMDKSSYGEFSNYASWQATLVIITSMELYNTLGRAYYDYNEEYDRYVSSLTVATVLLTGIFYGLFLLCRDWLLQIIAIPAEYIHLLFFSMACMACKSMFIARARTLYRYKTVAALSVINLVVPTLIAVSLVALADPAARLSARIYGHYIPSATIGLVCACVLVWKGRCFKLEHVRYAVKLALPMVLHYLTAHLLTSSNTIITKSIQGASAAAMVSISASTIHILTIFFGAVSGAATTWVMDNLHQNNRAKLRRDTMYYVGLITLVALAVILLAPEVILILGGKQYAEAVVLIPGLVTAVMFQSVTSLFSIILTFEKKVVAPAVWTGVVAVLSIAAKIWLTGRFGYIIHPFVNMVAFGALYLINYRLVKNVGWADAVNFKGYNIIMLLVLGMMGLSYVLYEHTLLRYGVILVFAAVALVLVIKNRQMLLRLLRGRKKSADKPAEKQE